VPQKHEQTENEGLSCTGNQRLLSRCTNTAWIPADSLIKSCSCPAHNNLEAPRRRIPSAEVVVGPAPNPVRMSRPWLVPDWRVPDLSLGAHDCRRFRLPRRLIRAAASTLTSPPQRSASSSPAEGLAAVSFPLAPSSCQSNGHQRPASTLERCHPFGRSHGNKMSGFFSLVEIEPGTSSAQHAISSPASLVICSPDLAERPSHNTKTTSESRNLFSLHTVISVLQSSISSAGAYPKIMGHWTE